MNYLGVIPQENSEAYTEYCNMKKSIYPYWQSIFHYKEWNDDKDSHKEQCRKNLKQRIIDALKWMRSNSLYEYTPAEIIEKELRTQFPFRDNENTKQNILLAKGKYNEMFIVVDSMCHTICVDLKRK